MDFLDHVTDTQDCINWMIFVFVFTILTSAAALWVCWDNSRRSLARALWVIAALCKLPSGFLTILTGDTSALSFDVWPSRKGATLSLRSKSNSSSISSSMCIAPYNVILCQFASNFVSITLPILLLHRSYQFWDCWHALSSKERLYTIEAIFCISHCMITYYVVFKWKRARFKAAESRRAISQLVHLYSNRKSTRHELWSHFSIFVWL